MVGIVGDINTNTNINQCINKAQIKGEYSVGGIIGANNHSDSKSVVINQCKNEGQVSGQYYIGGIVGIIKGDTQVSSCTNIGNITDNGYTNISWKTGSNSYNFVAGVLGGIVAYCENSTIIDCFNNAQLTVESNSSYSVECGGIVAIAWNNSNITRCQNGEKGILSNTNTSSYTGIFGGIVGNLGYSDVDQCFNKGEINATGKNLVGGIVGHAWSFTLSNCYNLGKITGGSSSIGGVIAHCQKYIDNNKKNYAYNCYNSNTDIKGNSNVGNWAGYLEYLEGNSNYSVKNYTKIAKKASETTCTVTVTEYEQNNMKTNDFLNLLNTGNGTGKWTINSDVNNGYPYLINNVPK